MKAPLPLRRPGCTCRENIVFAAAAPEADIDRWRRSHACCDPLERVDRFTTFASRPEWDAVKVTGRLVVVVVLGVPPTLDALGGAVKVGGCLSDRLLERGAERVLFAFRLDPMVPT